MTNRSERAVALPYGIWRDGQATHALRLRAVSGEDELALEEALSAGAAPLDLATLLIARCAHDAAGAPIGEPMATALVLGDREVVLRALHAISFSRHVEANIACAQGCGETIECTLDLDGLVAPAPEPGPLHALLLDGAVVQARPPTGRDLGQAMRAADPAAHLIAACAGDPSIDRAALAAELARLDPNAECAIDVGCPACGGATRLYLDGFELLRRALRAGGGILTQIHLLARSYGWREADILALPRARRLRYCEMAGGAA